MGMFYTNFVAFGGDPDSALAVMRERRCRGYVTPVISGAVTVFDAGSDSQDTDILERLGADLSEKLKVPVLAVLNHDDDHLLLWIFRNGRQVAHYGSFVHAFVFASSLSRVRGGFLAYPLIVGVLGWPTFIFQSLRHTLLAWLLDLPRCSVGSGFEYISRGEIPRGLRVDDLTEV